jgi:hypothetical protein
MNENVLVGLVALALVPLIAMRIVRGMRDGRLPLYRTYLERKSGRAKFNFLLALHALSLIAIAIVAADLLFNTGLLDAL